MDMRRAKGSTVLFAGSEEAVKGTSPGETSETGKSVFALLGSCTLKTLAPFIGVVVLLGLLDVWQEIFFIGSVVDFPPIGLSTHHVYMATRIGGFLAAALLVGSKHAQCHKRAMIGAVAGGLCLSAVCMFASLTFGGSSVGLASAGTVVGGMSVSMALVMSLACFQGVAPLFVFLGWVCKNLLSLPFLVACYSIPFAGIAMLGVAVPVIWAAVASRLAGETVDGKLGNFGSGSVFSALPMDSSSKIPLPIAFLLIAVFGFVFAFREPSMGNGVFEPGSYSAAGSAIVEVAILVLLCKPDWKRYLTRLFQTAFPMVTVVYCFMPADYEAFQDIADVCSTMADALVMLLVLLVVSQASLSRNLSFGRVAGTLWCCKTIGVWLGETFWLLLASQGFNVAIIDVVVSALTLLAVGVAIVTCTSSGLFDDLFRLSAASQETAASPDGGHGIEALLKADAAWVTALFQEKGLTPREEEICAYLLGDDPYSAIERALYISKDTLKTHRQNIFRKFDVHSREELKEAIEARRPKEQGAG